MKKSSFLAAALLLSTVACTGCSAPASPGPRAAVVRIGSRAIRQGIPGGFVGLSMEYTGMSAYAGDNPSAPNPIFEQLVRNLAPGQSPVLRIGGDSTDWAWWPVPGIARPRGMRLTLDPRTLAVGHALTKDLNARLILGINLEADSSRIAAAMARALINGFGRSAVRALELGNEPELYASYGWYRTATGRKIPGRPRSWSFPAFTHDFATIARSLPPVPLAGPSTGSPNWMSQLKLFLANEPRLGLVTLHRYPFKHCAASDQITAAQLLSDPATKGLADSVASYVALAHARGVPLRVAEMNAISCGGQRGVSDTFASALWALDALFQMARVGVDGVNIHTATGKINEIFTFRQVNGEWRGSVSPIYYGLMTFAKAVPAGSQLLQVSGPGGGLSSYATRAPDGHIRVVLINKDLDRSRTIAVRGLTAATGTLELLRAPSIDAKDGITLGGQGFGAQTSTGVLSGPSAASTVKRTDGRFLIPLPPATAALLTL